MPVTSALNFFNPITKGAQHVKLFFSYIAIQTLQGVGRGKEGSEWVRQLVWGKYLDEAQGGHDLARLFSGGKTIEVRPQSN